MWKYVTRGLRESLERRTNCRTNIYSHSSQDGVNKSEVSPSVPVNQQVLPPSINRAVSECYGYQSNDGTKDNGHNSNWNPKYSWSDAVGWSGILAVGWVVCQSLCLHRRFFGPDPDLIWRKKICQGQDIRISNLLGQLLNFQPRHVLPITNCIGYQNESNNEWGADASWTSKKPFGPITVEEALEEAGDDFTRAHKIAMGELEFHMGMKAIEEKRFKEAVKHFSTGASLSSPCSMFNLAVCYEAGVGTLVDYAKAAKHYRAAADNGHADAMYNLGVFHAQGRGGLPVNMNAARQLFRDAARLGQPQAQHALSLEAPVPANVVESKVIEPATRCVPIDGMEMNDKKSASLFAQLISLRDRLNSTKEVTSNQNPLTSDWIENSKNSTEELLNLLGLTEPSSISRNDTVTF